MLGYNEEELKHMGVGDIHPFINHVECSPGNAVNIDNQLIMCKIELNVFAKYLPY